MAIPRTQKTGICPLLHAGHKALLRREHPEATLSELAELHEPPTSKSTVNHRMRKLLALAAEGTETTEEGPA